jgi:hypothetical protein
MHMMLDDARFASVAVALALVAGCGQDLDFGSFAGARDGLNLPPAPSASAPACAVQDPAALPLPSVCHPDKTLRRVSGKEGTFDYKYTDEICVVTADNRSIPLNGTVQLPACPLGLYLKFVSGSWRLPASPPVPPDGRFPSAEAFERAIWVLGDDGAPSDNPFEAEGWQLSTRNVTVLPDQRAVFVTFDPRAITAPRFFVVLSLAELMPDVVPENGNPTAFAWPLRVASGTGPVVEARGEASRIGAALAPKQSAEPYDGAPGLTYKFAPIE